MLGELRTINRAEHEVDHRVFIAEGPLSLFGALLSAAGLLWAVHSASTGKLTLGDVSVFVAAVAGVQVAFSGIIAGAADIYGAAMAFGHYLAVVGAASDLPEAERPIALGPLTRGISLRDVWFRYTPDGPWILRGVDLDIPAGADVAIVGVNGAGKSTLVKLLCRFYDPTRGAITWDGVDIRDVTVADLRERIGAVFQDYMEYDLTVRENIGVGDLPRLDDRHRIEEAAKRSEIHESIAALPRGYDTLLSRLYFAEKRTRMTPRPECDCRAVSGNGWPWPAAWTGATC